MKYLRGTRAHRTAGNQRAYMTLYSLGIKVSLNVMTNTNKAYAITVASLFGC